MAFIALPKEWIPNVQVGNILYTHYPIQDLTRPEADRILRHLEKKILLRTSANALKASPEMYYVATYFIPGREDSVNRIITRAEHDANEGRLHRLLSYPTDDYSLLIQNSPFFMDTTETNLSDIQYQITTE